jgi:hypothetical protein
MYPDSPVIAMWDVSGETLQAMTDEAYSDAKIFLAGLTDQHHYTVEVMNCEPLNTENNRVIEWKGKAIIT